MSSPDLMGLLLSLTSLSPVESKVSITLPQSKQHRVPSAPLAATFLMHTPSQLINALGGSTSYRRLDAVLSGMQNILRSFRSDDLVSLCTFSSDVHFLCGMISHHVIKLQRAARDIEKQLAKDKASALYDAISDCARKMSRSRTLDAYQRELVVLVNNSDNCSTHATAESVTKMLCASGSSNLHLTVMGIGLRKPGRQTLQNAFSGAENCTVLLTKATAQDLARAFEQLADAFDRRRSGRC